MAHGRRVITGLVVLMMLSSLPLYAARKRGDVGNSQDGFFSNCPPDPNGGVCAFAQAQGAATLTGTDKSGNPVAVTINLYDWGFYPCTQDSCQSKPLVNFAVLDVVLAATDSAGIESLVVKGSLATPSYVSCDTFSGGLGCIYSPLPDSSDVPEPTPIAGGDSGGHINTRWDFGGVPPLDPPLPAIPFDQLLCVPGDDPQPADTICQSSPLGEAILVVANSVKKNKLTTAAKNYLVTLTDGTKLGTLAVPKSPTEQVITTNNTQATATLITGTSFRDYTDSSQAYPLINADGTEQYPQGFTPLPLTNPPPCNPINDVTGQIDNRTFRTAWYAYTAPSNGSVTISTAGSRYDTLLYVFTGNASQPTVIACDDDPFPSNGLLQAATAFNVTQGTNYQIVVGETPTYQTNAPGSLTGYPLSVDGTLYFNLQFSTNPVKAPTVTTLTSFPNPSTLGQTVNFTATVVTNGIGTPSGTVTFNDGSTLLGTSSLSGGTAVVSTAALPAGANSITATYSGDSNFSGSTSAVLLQDVLAPTTTILTSSLNPSKPGVAVTFTATLTSAAGTPSGTVQFLNGDTPLKTVSLVAGVAQYKTTKLPLGSNIITAIYTGDFTGSTSNAVNQIVQVDISTILYSFTAGADGGYPYSSLLLDAQNNLYGTTSQGGDSVCNCGSVFKIDATGHETVLHSFTGADGAYPYAGLVRDAQGNLYGTTSYGGASGDGTVFTIAATGEESVLYSFTGTGGDGAFPQAGLILDGQGNLYGTTSEGGNLACPLPSGGGCGTVFNLSPPGGGAGPWNETVLYAFTGIGGDGAFPQAGLIEDASGNFYGTTFFGGSLSCPGFYGCGTVFKLSAAGQETVLHAFSSTAGDGGFPEATLIQDAQGNLYGSTLGGGTLDDGNLFKMTTTGQQTVLYTFTGGADGAAPAAGLILDNKGNLYGTTTEGGDLTCPAGSNFGCGGVFQLTAKGKRSVLHIFFGTGGDGAVPYAGLVRDAQGNLYGTTFYGGAYGAGTVFKLTPQ